MIVVMGVEGRCVCVGGCRWIVMTMAKQHLAKYLVSTSVVRPKRPRRLDLFSAAPHDARWCVRQHLGPKVSLDGV